MCKNVMTNPQRVEMEMGIGPWLRVIVEIDFDESRYVAEGGFKLPFILDRSHSLVEKAVKQLFLADAMEQS